MIIYLNRLLQSMRPAFSRQATFVWFVVVFVGFVLRQDTYGVSSLIRALSLTPVCYPCLLHFFHSYAWTSPTILEYWWQWLIKEKTVYRVGESIVLLGDHTKCVKDGRRMPGVSTLHQDSETGSKPSFFRGHQWGCISMLMKAASKFVSTPLWVEIHHDAIPEKRSTRIVSVARHIAQAMHTSAYLVLDAFFAVGPVFQTAAQEKENVKIITRAKKNVVGYLPPVKTKKTKAGRPPVYGKKLKLMRLFDKWTHKFIETDTQVYENTETVRYLVLDLLWKPIKRKLRFILIESSRGKIILMTSDLMLEPLLAIHLYCQRSAIETLFNTLKNLLGGMRYHFWSKYLQPSSRRPAKKKKPKPVSSNPEKTQNTLSAIENFVIVQIIVLGTLQLLAGRFSNEIIHKSNCWLRTPCGIVPSEFVTRTALSNVIRNNLIVFAKDAITQLILKKQSKRRKPEHLNEVA